MTNEHKGFIAGLALGSFVSMLLVLFSILAVPTLAAAITPLATLGVFLGVFAATLVGMSWATTPSCVSCGFLVAELA